jgi:hypothetical protein
MNKLLIAASTALLAFAPMGAQASVRNTVIATTAVSYCNYMMGHMSIEEASKFGAQYLNGEGISPDQSNSIMAAPSFNDDVIRAIEIGGGCEKITAK